MHIEKEDSNRIKVILKSIDLRKMNVSIENLKPDSPQLHDFLYEVMERVREETGFNPYHGQIVVEASHMGDGMVLTVTRVSDRVNKMNVNRAKIRKARATLKNQEEAVTAFIFYEFDDFFEGVKLLSARTLMNTYYYKYKGYHVLLVKGVLREEKCRLREYASRIKCGQMLTAFFAEHAELIASGEKMVSMADGISKL